MLPGPGRFFGRLATAPRRFVLPLVLNFTALVFDLIAYTRLSVKARRTHEGDLS
jgi:hypothetical protein